MPGAKRGMIVTHKNTLQFLDNEKFLLLYNFTPAASVSVIGIEKRKVLAEDLNSRLHHDLPIETT